MQSHKHAAISVHAFTRKFLPVLFAAALLLLPAASARTSSSTAPFPAAATPSAPSETKQYIKWVDFGVTADAMRQALRYDVESYNQEPHLSWIDLLAWLGARYGGDFSRYKPGDLDALAEKIKNGESLESLTDGMKYFSYYQEAYGAVLGGMVGTFQIQIPDEATREPVWVTKYGLKAFSPIAKNYPYNDYDDFGASRSYGFKRQHLGHDLMGQVGTPVIAVESGYVEAIGWNQYGGWRLGIRSFDKKRYYYYAHLRKNYPYHKTLQEGSIVQAGDVIGYLGRTGYSRTENTNNIDTPHLHFGMQLIFDESQKDSNHEIWIDCYELTRFLAMNRSETIKNQETKEYYRVWQMKDPAIPGGAAPQSISSGSMGNEAQDSSPGASETGSQSSAPGFPRTRSQDSAPGSPETGSQDSSPGFPGTGSQDSVSGASGTGSQHSASGASGSRTQPVSLSS